MDSNALHLKARHIDDYAILGNQLGNELIEMLPKGHAAIDRMLNAQLQIMAAGIAIKEEIKKLQHEGAKTKAG